MDFKEVLKRLNIFAQCKKYQVPLWQCPQFLFLIMGVFIMATAPTIYYLGVYYGQDPQLVALITFSLTVVMLIVAFSITQGFEKLAEANRMKSEFVRVVSHQLRSPLSNLNWALQFLASGKAGSLKEKQLGYLDLLQQNTERMQELISDLVLVSKMEQERLLEQKEKVSLSEIIEELIKEFEPLAQASKVKVEFEKESVPEVFANRSQIKLVIENLLDNAIRYSFPETEQGQVRIKLQKKGNRVYFEIKDNGVGIPKSEQKYIFKKFFRSENVMRYQTQGSGLGLYISRKIIQRSGGKMGFESQEGKGSTFWFTLPIT